jgi:hypothetical protein
MSRAGVDVSDPAAMQGRELVKSFVRALNEITRSLAYALPKMKINDGMADDHSK